jgi:hypothetical protein
LDGRVLGAGASALGLVIGVVVMLAAMPDTGAPIDGALPAEDLTSSVPAAAEEPPPTDELAPPPMPPPDLDFGAVPTEVPNPFGGDPPPPGQPRPFMHDPLGRGGVDGETDGMYRADVRGVQKLFLDHTADVATCMSEHAPEAMPGESRVMVRVHLLTTEGETPAGRIDRIEAVRNEEGRYDRFIACLTGKVKDVQFEAPRAGTSTVNWSIRR